MVKPKMGEIIDIERCNVQKITVAQRIKKVV